MKIQYVIIEFDYDVVNHFESLQRFEYHDGKVKVLLGDIELHQVLLKFTLKDLQNKTYRYPNFKFFDDVQLYSVEDNGKFFVQNFKIEVKEVELQY